MKHVFIINPAAGKRNQSEQLHAEIAALFEPREEQAVILTTERRGHAVELAAGFAAGSEPATIYACGGDGTLSEAAKGIDGAKHCRIAPVPIGSGNDFIRCFGEDAVERFRSLEALVNGTARQLDLLRVDGQLALNIVSAGLDAITAQRMEWFKRLPLVSGPMAYKLSLGYNFFSSLRNRYAFEIDGVYDPPADYIFALAANGRYYGGGFLAAPYSDIQDGLIDFICIPTLPRLKTLTMIGSYKRGEHLERYDCVRLIRCKTLRILAERPIAVNLDGEIREMTNPCISIEPLAITMVFPESVGTEKQRASV